MSVIRVPGRGIIRGPLGAGIVRAPAPGVVAISGIALTPSTGAAASPVGTVVGALAATFGNGVRPVNPVWTLTDTASGCFALASRNQVVFAGGNVPAGTYSVTARLAADNLPTPMSTAISIVVSAGAAAGYTLSQQVNSGVWAAPVSYVTIAAPSGGWPAGTLVVALGGVGGCIGNVVGAAQGGGVLTPADSHTPITFCAVAAAPGTLTMATTNTMGLADPAALSFAVTNPAAAPPAMSDIVVCMPYPSDPGDHYQPAGWCEPVGGIGPFGLSIAGNAWQVMGSPGERLTFASWDEPRATSITLTVTDARGAQVSKTVTPPTLPAGSALLPFNAPNPQRNNTTQAIGGACGWRTQNGAYALSTPDGSAGISDLTDQYGFVWPTSTPVAPRVEQVKVSRGSQSVVLPLVIAPYTNPGWIEFVPTTVSTSMGAGSIVGQCHATTSNNSPSYALSDAAGILQVSAGGQVTIKTQPTAAGSYPYSITVTDGLSSYTQQFALTVQPGNTLPASNMSFANLTSSFSNDTYNNVVGTPTVSGITGTPTWSLADQTGLCVTALSGQPATFQIDQNTGQITCPQIMPAGNAYLDGSGNVVRPSYAYTLKVLCSDGINSCTASVVVTSNWAPTALTIHVGRGQSSKGYAALAQPTVGYETMTEARLRCIPRHAGTFVVIVHADADPEYYTNDNGSRTTNYDARYAWQGPVIVQGVASDDGSVLKPRLGGPASLTQPGGGDMRGKGFIVFGDGDGALINVEGSGCHDGYGDGSHGIEFVRKDGQTPGTLSLLKCYIHDCDNGVETGFGHMRILVDGCLIEGNGTSHVSSGACHNIYVGAVYSLIFRNSVSRHVNLGHLLKTRAQVTTAQNSRIYDGIGGSASACINACNGGVVTITGCAIEKGAMAFGPGMIRYGDEGLIHPVNTLSVTGNSLSDLFQVGNHSGNPVLLDVWLGTNANGVPITATLSGNSYWGVPGLTKVSQAQNGNTGGGTAAVINDDNTWTQLALPPALDLTRPDQAGTLAPYAWLYRQQFQDDFSAYAGVQQLAAAPQLRVPTGAAAGTAITAVRASIDLGAIGQGTTNPFGAGTAWAIDTTPTFYGQVPWPPAGRYSVTANSDGTAALKVAGALPAANSVDVVQLRATAPGSGGATVLMRYPVLVTA